MQAPTGRFTLGLDSSSIASPLSPLSPKDAFYGEASAGQPARRRRARSSPVGDRPTEQLVFGAVAVLRGGARRGRRPLQRSAEVDQVAVGISGTSDPFTPRLIFGLGDNGRA